MALFLLHDSRSKPEDESDSCNKGFITKLCVLVLSKLGRNKRKRVEMFLLVHLENENDFFYVCE